MDINKNIHECMNKMKNIEAKVLEYIDDLDVNEFNYLDQFLDEQEVKTNKGDLNFFLHLISQIGDNHQRTDDFFKKIETIIHKYQSEILKFFSNLEIFHFFEANKRILLFLFEEGILTQEKKVMTIIQKRHKNYLPYLFPDDKKIEDYEKFEEKRLKGENDSYLCELIRNDYVEEFIIYCNERNYSLRNQIQESIFETNSIFLCDDQKNAPTLIEYAAFFGAIQIVQYLIMNDVDIKPSVWIYAVHSNNADLIHLLEDKQDEPNDKIYETCLIESIKCHNYNFMNYFDDNYNPQKYFFMKGMKYHNFQYIMNHSFEIKTNPTKIYNYSRCKCICLKSWGNTSNDYLIPWELFIYCCIKYDFIQFVQNYFNQMKKFFQMHIPKDKSSNYLLNTAVQKENYNIIQLLLSYDDFIVNFRSSDKKKFIATPLHIAIFKSNIEIVNFLLTKNVDLSKNVNIGQTTIPTLKFAFQQDQIDIFKSLLSYLKLDKMIKCYEEKKYHEGILYVAALIRKVDHIDNMMFQNVITSILKLFE